MHPILSRLDRAAAYLGAWLIAGILLAAVLERQGTSWGDALLFVVPTIVVYAFISLSAWYVCRAMPLETSRAPAVTTALAVAGLSGGLLWLGVARFWMSVLRVLGLDTAAEAGARHEPLLFPVAVVLYLLVLAVHYVALAFESARAAERQQLELQVLTRDAELRALRAQIDPHFLYNSLNSISALTTTDAAGARRMCLMLADFLRNTLKVSGMHHIPLAEELALVEAFIGIEQVRFGSRLALTREIDSAAMTCLVPPLILQPLAENAVAHGVAGLLEGGTIRLSAERHDRRLVLRMANPRDPDVPPRRRGGVGLENVRRRLQAAFPGTARIDAVADQGGFRVELTLPCVEK